MMTEDFVVEWEGLSFGAGPAKQQILQYLELERSDESDMVLVEAFLDELLDNISRCAPRRATIDVTWREDGAALLEVRHIEPTIHPTGIAPTTGWRLMLASALNEALDVKPAHDGDGECLTAVLPLRRKDT
jgi:hypothetical protein